MKLVFDMSGGAADDDHDALREGNPRR